MSNQHRSLNDGTALPPTVGEAIKSVIDEMTGGEQLRFFVFSKRVGEAYGEPVSPSLVKYVLKNPHSGLGEQFTFGDTVPGFITKLAPEPDPEPTQYQLAYLGHDDFDSRPLIEIRGEDDHELIAVSLNQSYDYLAGIDLFSDHVDVGVWNEEGEWVVVTEVSLDWRGLER